MDIGQLTSYRFTDLDLLHPRVVKQFRQLHARMLELHALGQCPVSFQIFETYRTPWRQAEVLRTGNSKAGPYSSAHQFGLAVDFVPKIAGNWTWDVPKTTWDILRSTAHSLNLFNDIKWDRAHVEHPLFRSALSDFIRA